MEAFLLQAERLVWGWPLLTLLPGAGLFLLLRLRGFPLRRLPRAVGLALRGSGETGKGVSSFEALCTALSAAIGTGNIVGVAGALALGGPGALLWMELSALTGLSLKYAEGLLSVRYRFRNEEGRPWGGPFAYILLGLGPRWRPLARCFALCCAGAGLLGVGTLVQVGSVSACLSAFLYRIRGTLTMLVFPGGARVPLGAFLLGLGMAVASALVIFGGIRRVSRLSSVLVPAMGGAYILCCLWILARRIDALPVVLRAVASGAFRPKALGGGLLGTVMAGVSRGVFSNEAGLGTAPIAAASAEEEDPVRQGLISMTATVFDTFVICTLTGLTLLVTETQSLGVSGAMEAFSRGLPLPEAVSMGLVLGFLLLFSFTTVLGWSCYGSACLDFLTNGSGTARRIYLLLYAATAALAPFCSARGIWAAASICNGLMALPNVSALLLLSPEIRRISDSDG